MRYVIQVTLTTGQRRRRRTGNGNEQGCARSAGAWRDRKLVAAAVEEPVRRRLRGAARAAVAGRGVRSGQGALCRGLETTSGGTRRIPQSARHLQSRRGGRCADGGQVATRRAAGGRAVLRPTQT